MISDKNGDLRAVFIGDVIFLNFLFFSGFP